MKPRKEPLRTLGGAVAVDYLAPSEGNFAAMDQQGERVPPGRGTGPRQVRNADCSVLEGATLKTIA